MDLIEEMLHEIGVAVPTIAESPLEDTDDNDNGQHLLHSNSTDSSPSSTPPLDSSLSLSVASEAQSPDLQSLPPSSQSRSRKRPLASPQTPHLTPKRHHGDSSDVNILEFIRVSPDRRTPVKPDIDALLNSIARASTRAASLPLSAQAEALRKKARRAMLTPSRPPFHQSPARPNTDTGLFTPQFHNDDEVAKQRRRHSDGASLTNRKLRMSDVPHSHSLPVPAASANFTNIVVTPPASPSVPESVRSVTKNDTPAPQLQLAAPSTPASASGRPRRRAAARSQKVLF